MVELERVPLKLDAATVREPDGGGVEGSDDCPADADRGRKLHRDSPERRLTRSGRYTVQQVVPVRQLRRLDLFPIIGVEHDGGRLCAFVLDAADSAAEGESAWRVHVLQKWGGMPVSEIRQTAVQSWLSELGAVRSATTVIRVYGVLAGILDEAVSDRRILVNPARGVNLPRKTKKPHVYLSHEQVHDLAAASKYPALILTLAYCGLRWGEATGLRVRHLDMLKRRITVEENAVQVGSRIEVGTSKNHKRRSVPFPRFLAELLARECEEKARDDLVFPAEGGGYLRSARVHEDNMSWLAGAVKRAGSPRITPHDLRHTAASFAVSSGANVKGDC